MNRKIQKTHLIEKLCPLEKKIGYFFKNKNILLESMLHSSFVNENVQLSLTSNERLEFLGDAVLDLIISDYLFWQLKKKDEGVLSLKRSALVRESSLAKLGKKMKIQDFLIVGKGELKENGYKRDSVLSDTLEALLGAIYLDSGIENTRKVIEKLFSPLLKNIRLIENHYNFKNQIQEYTQKYFQILPQYRVSSEKGPDHDRTFRVCVYIKDRYITIGSGPSKKKAEQSASKNALSILKKKKKYFRKLLGN